MNREGIASFFALLRDYEGVATWGLFVIAIVAGAIAERQLRQNRKLRFEQARPYVVVGLRRVGHGIVELYVKNFGETAAHDVKLASDPDLESLSDPAWFRVFDNLPTLVPGDEWSTLWETDASKRAEEGDFSNTYTVTLTYTGNDGRKKKALTDTFNLDWRPHLASTYVERNTIHDIGATLKKIEGSLKPHKLKQAIASAAAQAPPGPSPQQSDDFAADTSEESPLSRLRRELVATFCPPRG